MGSPRHEEAVAAAAERPGWRMDEVHIEHPTRGIRIEFHTYPVADIRRHRFVQPCGSLGCACKPVYEEYANGWTVVHNSFDGREIIEELEAMPA